MCSKMTKKGFTLALIVFLIYIGLLVFLARYVKIDSDYANLVLEANEIIHGNVFLNGWNLTGLSFITTDLLYFVVGAFIFGLSTKTYFVAVGLMIAVVNLIGFLLVSFERDDKCSGILYICVAGLPCIAALSALRAHTGAVIWAFIAILLIAKWKQEHKIRMLVLCAVSIAFGAMGDPMTLIIAVMPMIVLAGVFFLRGKDNWIEARAFFVTGIVGAMAGVVLDKIYFVVGGANKNEALGNRFFVDYGEWSNTTRLLVEKLLDVADASFMNHTLIAIDTLPLFLNTFLLLFGLIVGIKTIYNFIRGKESDIISVMLSLSIFIHAVILIVTSIVLQSNDCSRYLVFIVIALPILIGRNLTAIASFCKFDKGIFKYAIVSLAVLVLLFRVAEWKTVQMESTDQEKLTEVLLDEGLENGYSYFWNASSITVISKGAVTVRAIRDYLPYIWFCKDEWYEEPANFVIVNDGNGHGITRENAMVVFGNPVREVEAGIYTIMIYDKDISDLTVGIE